MDDFERPASRGELPRREVMQTPEEVAAMLGLKALGWGVRRIAGELGCSHMTVRRYLAEGGWVAYRGRGRPRRLAGLEEWVAERFRQHAGNADVVRQELVEPRLAVRRVDRLLECSAKFSLLSDAVEDSGATFVQLAQIPQPLIEHTQLGVIERFGHLLPVAGNKGHGRSAI